MIVTRTIVTRTVVFSFPYSSYRKCSLLAIYMLKEEIIVTDSVKGSNFTLGLISRIATVCPRIS